MYWANGKRRQRRRNRSEGTGLNQPRLNFQIGQGADILRPPPDEKVYAMIRKFVFATMMGGLLLGATACNTVKGAGQDLQSASQSTEEAINN